MNAWDHQKREKERIQMLMRFQWLFCSPSLRHFHIHLPDCCAYDSLKVINIESNKAAKMSSESFASPERDAIALLAHVVTLVADRSQWLTVFDFDFVVARVACRSLPRIGRSLNRWFLSTHQNGYTETKSVPNQRFLAFEKCVKGKFKFHFCEVLNFMGLKLWRFAHLKTISLSLGEWSRDRAPETHFEKSLGTFLLEIDGFHWPTKHRKCNERANSFLFERISTLLTISNR